MNTVKIHTTQNIEIEYDLASLGERIVARLLDMAIIIAYIIVFLIIANLFIDSLQKNTLWLVLIDLLPVIFYDLISEIVMNGQSVGKRVMHIKVISLNGARPTFGQYMNRWLFRLVDFTLTGELCALITVAASVRKQRLGDMVAGTTLIRTKPRTTIEQTIYAPTSLGQHTVMFPEVAQLSDKDMQLVKEVILIANRTGQTMPAYHAAEKIKQLLQIQSNLESLPFLQVLMTDYNYLTAMS